MRTPGAFSIHCAAPISDRCRCKEPARGSTPKRNTLRTSRPLTKSSLSKRSWVPADSRTSPEPLTETLPALYRLALRRRVIELHERFVDIAPAPAFRRVVAFD